MLGVLWHPEEDETDRLIGAFVFELPGPVPPRRPRHPDDGRPAQPLKRGAIVSRAPRRKVSGSLRALVPLADENVTRATRRWRPKPYRVGLHA